MMPRVEYSGHEPSLHAVHSYGDVYPVTSAGRAIITLVSTCGFVLQLFHIVLVVQTALNHAAQGDAAGHTPSAWSKFRLLLPVYLVALCISLVLGLLMHAAGGIEEVPGCGEDDDECGPDLMDSLYLLWMTTHGSAFGEIIPAGFAGRLITWLAMVTNYGLVIGFAALTAIPNQGNFKFISIPLLQAQGTPAASSVDVQPQGAGAAAEPQPEPESPP